MTTFEILTPFTASPDGVRIKQYQTGDIVTPSHPIEFNQLSQAVQRGQAGYWIPKAVENRTDKVKTAPKRK